VTVDHLFVYGTLRRDAKHEMYHLLARHAGFVGDGVFQGRLFDLGDYPGATPSDDPSDQVRGEVYALQDADRVLAALDVYEGCIPDKLSPTEFRREIVEITLDAGMKESAHIYLYNKGTDGLPCIVSGDYFRRRSTGRPRARESARSRRGRVPL